MTVSSSFVYVPGTRCFQASIGRCARWWQCSGRSHHLAPFASSEGLGPGLKVLLSRIKSTECLRVAWDIWSTSLRESDATRCSKSPLEVSGAFVFMRNEPSLTVSVSPLLSTPVVLRKLKEREKDEVEPSEESRSRTARARGDVRPDRPDRPGPLSKARDASGPQGRDAGSGHMCNKITLVAEMPSSERKVWYTSSGNGAQTSVHGFSHEP